MHYSYSGFGATAPCAERTACEAELAALVAEETAAKAKLKQCKAVAGFGYYGALGDDCSAVDQSKIMGCKASLDSKRANISFLTGQAARECATKASGAPSIGPGFVKTGDAPSHPIPGWVWIMGGVAFVGVAGVLLLKD